MPEYVITRVKVPCWNSVPAVELHHTGWLPACEVTAQAQACYDGDSLFLRLQAWEHPIRATLRGPLEQVCNDSCLEFFFAPMPGNQRYFNFEFNPLGTMYLGFGAQRNTRVRQVVRDQKIFQICPFSTGNSWGVTFAIPGEFIRLYFPEFNFSGTAWGNFYKCGDETPAPHYLAWTPLDCGTPDFHRRQDFGRLTFG